MAGHENKKKRIKNFSVDETSVVDEGANLKTFHIIKNKNGEPSMDELEAILKSYGVAALADPAKAKQEIKKQLGENASDDAVNKVMGAMTLLKSAREDLGFGMSMSSEDEGAFIAIRKSSSLTIEKSKSDGELKTAKEDLEKIEKSKTELETSHTEALTAKDTQFKERIAKALEVVSAGDKDKLEKALNGNVTIVDLSPEAKAEIKKAKDERDTDRKELVSIRRELNKAKYVENAKILKSIQGTEDEKAELLQKCAEVLEGEDFNQLHTILKAANAQIEKGALFAENGSVAEATATDDSKEAQIVGLCKAKMAADSTITIEKSRDLVLQERPELYY